MKKVFFGCTDSAFAARAAEAFEAVNGKAFVSARDNAEHEFQSAALYALSDAALVRMAYSSDYADDKYMRIYTAVVAARYAKGSSPVFECEFEHGVDKNEFARWLISEETITLFIGYYPYVRDSGGSVDYKDTDAESAVKWLSDLYKRIFGEAVDASVICDALDEYYFVNDEEQGRAIDEKFEQRIKNMIGDDGEDFAWDGSYQLKDADDDIEDDEEEDVEDEDDEVEDDDEDGDDYDEEIISKIKDDIRNILKGIDDGWTGHDSGKPAARNRERKSSPGKSEKSGEGKDAGGDDGSRPGSPAPGDNFSVPPSEGRNADKTRIYVLDGVDRLDMGFISHNDELEELHLPSSIKKLDAGCVIFCPNLKKVVFDGTCGQWEAVRRSVRWTDRDVTVQCSDGYAER